jgi:hypothetical protein
MPAICDTCGTELTTEGASRLNWREMDGVTHHDHQRCTHVLHAQREQARRRAQSWERVAAMYKKLLVDQTVERSGLEPWDPTTDGRRCRRCGAVNPAPQEDCIAGKEVPGAGTEPHDLEWPQIEEPSPASAMSLWLVKDDDRWGWSLNVVRAGSEQEAVQLVCGRTPKRPELVEVTPLLAEGLPAILWCEDESPDTGDRD